MKDTTETVGIPVDMARDMFFALCDLSERLKYRGTNEIFHLVTELAKNINCTYQIDGIMPEPYQSILERFEQAYKPMLEVLEMESRNVKDT